jgi:putative Mg2+ transporter-C (MgtC) family protein
MNALNRLLVQKKAPTRRKKEMSPELEAGLRLLLAAVLGGCIGFQREKAGKPAGLRTHMLLCMGSALFSVVSISVRRNVDPARVAAGVVTGIGFIGAGVIFRGMRGDRSWASPPQPVSGLRRHRYHCRVGLYIIAVATALVTVLVLMIPRAKG